MIFDTIIWYFKSLFLACGHILIGNLIIRVFTLSQQKSDSFFSPSAAYIDGLSFLLICVKVGLLNLILSSCTQILLHLMLCMQVGRCFVFFNFEKGCYPL